MTPPRKPIRVELAEAVVNGIRERGPEAVGLVLVGGARLFLAFATLLVIHLFGVGVLGIAPLSVPIVSGAIAAAAVGLAAALHSWPASSLPWDHSADDR